ILQSCRDICHPWINQENYEELCWNDTNTMQHCKEYVDCIKQTPTPSTTTITTTQTTTPFMTTTPTTTQTLTSSTATSTSATSTTIALMSTPISSSAATSEVGIDLTLITLILTILCTSIIVLTLIVVLRRHCMKRKKVCTDPERPVDTCRYSPLQSSEAILIHFGDNLQDELTEIELLDIGKKMGYKIDEIAIRLNISLHEVETIKQSSPQNANDWGVKILKEWWNRQGRDVNKRKVLAAALRKSGKIKLAEEVQAKPKDNIGIITHSMLSTNKADDCKDHQEQALRKNTKVTQAASEMPKQHQIFICNNGHIKH
ncbi:unnamed protein product, partial [Owenia fusiformis]